MSDEARAMAMTGPVIVLRMLCLREDAASMPHQSIACRIKADTKNKPPGVADTGHYRSSCRARRVSRWMEVEADDDDDVLAKNPQAGYACGKCLLHLRPPN